MRRKVVTLHGVNPDPWQDSVHRILEPHFECVKIGYDDYDGLQGPIRVFCHPLALVGAVGALLGCLAAALTARWSDACILLPCAFLLMLGGALLAALLRRACAKRVKAEIGRLCGSSPAPPHVIAHSFGTYIVGQILKHQDVTLGRVALVGGVLPRCFDWQRLLEHDRPAFTEVRNETGTRDWVVWLAGRARWLAWDIGDSGLRGFLVRRGVHETSGPWKACDACVAPYPDSLVHNVPLRELEHSDVFLGPAHAQRIWLPFLWGIPPWEFQSYVTMCWDAAWYLQESLAGPFGATLNELAVTRWSWTHDEPLSGFAERMLRLELVRCTPMAVKAGGGLNKLVWLMLSRMCHHTVAAYTSAEDPIRVALHPHRALAGAARGIAEELV